MGMKAPVTGGDGAREVPPEGNYLAVCNGVYMIGTQPGFQGGDPKLQVLLSFELHKRKGAAKNSQGYVFEVNRTMTFTMNVKSTLAEYAGALRGKAYDEEELDEIRESGGFDPEQLIGKSCRLAIKHAKKLDGGIKDKIESVSKLDPDDDTAPEPCTDPVYWDWTLGVAVPKRIAYFWDRAAENPDRKAEPAPARVGAKHDPANNSYVINDGEDIPF